MSDPKSQRTLRLIKGSRWLHCRGDAERSGHSLASPNHQTSEGFAGTQVLFRCGVLRRAFPLSLIWASV